MTTAFCWFLGPHDFKAGAARRAKHLADALVTVGINIHFVRSPHPHKLPPHQQTMTDLRRHWMKERPLCVHVEVPSEYGDVWRLVATELGIPLICTWHPIFWMSPQHEQANIIKTLRGFIGSCQQVLAETEEVRLSLAAEGILDTTMSVNGVDSVSFAPSKRSTARRRQWGAEDNDPVILHAGRLQPEKNLTLLIRTCNQIAVEYPRAKFVVAGDGSMVGELKSQCPHLQMLGHIVGAELTEVFASADIFLFPSTEDMTGNVALEAAASGLALVAFDRAGAGAHFQESAALIPLGDEPAFIRQAVMLTGNQAARQHMGIAARQVAERISWRETAKQFLVAIQRAQRGFSKRSIPGANPFVATIRAALPTDHDGEPFATIRYLASLGHRMNWIHDGSIPLESGSIEIHGHIRPLVDFFEFEKQPLQPVLWQRLTTEGKLCAWAHGVIPTTQPIHLAACYSIPFTDSQIGHRFSRLMAELRSLGHAVLTHMDPLGNYSPLKTLDAAQTQSHLTNMAEGLTRAWTAHKPDLVYIESLDPFGLRAADIAEKMNIPWLATWRDPDFKSAASPYTVAKSDLTNVYSKATAIVTEDELSADKVKSLNLPHPTVIENGINGLLKRDEHAGISNQSKIEAQSCTWKQSGEKLASLLTIASHIS